MRTLTAVYVKRYNKTEWNDSLMTKEHVTDYLFSMAANEMRVGMAVMRMRLIQKAVASSEGFAFVAMAPPTVGKQVFLRVTTATTTVMRGMTAKDTTGQKAADGRKKSPATPVKK